jgi:fused signal recognition particle receptor
MFGFGKKKTQDSDVASMRKESAGLFSRLKQGLARTRANSVTRWATCLGGSARSMTTCSRNSRPLLLTADVGVDATRRIIDDLSQQVRRRELSDPRSPWRALRAQLASLLEKIDRPAKPPPKTAPWSC